MTVIKRLEITSFGKFKDYTLDLKPGLNELICENEFGKSTIADFILFILYGFTKIASKKTELEENLLKKYLPWNSEAILAGAIEIDCDGRFLRIERVQNDGRKKSVTVRDATGASIDIEDSPGKLIFGVDRQTFERTFLIRQTDIKFSGTGGLELALKNLVTTGDEDTSYEAAAETLRRKNSKYRHIDRQSGRIFDLKKQIAQLELDLAAKRRVSDSTFRLDTELLQLKQQYTQLLEKEKKYKDLLPLAKSADARRRLENIAHTEQNIKSISDRIEQFKKTGIDQNAIDEISKAYLELEINTKRKESAFGRVNDTESALKKAEKEFSRFNNIRQNERELLILFSKKPRPNAALCSAGIIIAAVGTALIMSSHLLTGAAAAVIGAAVTAAGIIFKSKVKVPSDYGMSLSELKCCYEQFKESDKLLQKLRYEYESAVSEYDRCEQILENSFAVCRQIEEKYKITDAREIEHLKNQLQEQAVLENNIAVLKEKRSELLCDTTLEQLKAQAELGDCKYTESEIQNLLLNIKDEQSNISEKITKLNEKEAELNRVKRSLFEISQKKDELQDELKNAQYQDSVLTIAREALLEAYEYISSKFAPMLTECAKQPLSEITDGKYDSITLDRQFNLRVKHNGTMYDLGYFSRGTADAVYFSVRVAVCQLISKKSGLPLIMDDPFWSLDDKRLKSARKVTEKISHNNQIIIFSARK